MLDVYFRLHLASEEEHRDGKEMLWRVRVTAANITSLVLLPGTMWQGARIAVVVPAYCEEERIARVIHDMPSFVDHVFVVDDASHDATAQVAAEAASASDGGRVRLLRHAENRGVGAAIVTGYRQALEACADVIAVMAGDAQMDPRDLERVVEPVILGQADYVKGNRFRHPRRRDMPLPRRLAGELLALVTRAATGLAISDSQCGYTAIAAEAASRLPLDELWPRFGYPNDLLGLLAADGSRVAEVVVRPVYAGERSGIRPWHAGLIVLIIARRWLTTRWHARRFAPQSAAHAACRSTPRARTAKDGS